MNLDIGLRREIIRTILRHKQAKKIVLYGSRARGDAKRTSDIDLAIIDPGWSSSDINLVKDALEEEVRTPLTFDLVHYDTLTKERLKEHIREEGKVIYEAGKN